MFEPAKPVDGSVEVVLGFHSQQSHSPGDGHVEPVPELEHLACLVAIAELVEPGSVDEPLVALAVAAAAAVLQLLAEQPYSASSLRDLWPRL